MIALTELTDVEVDERIWELKRHFKEELFIPVHHYQRDEIVKFADYTGDSLELSRVSSQTKAKYIVFCGVYFMAEISRTLASKDKYVFIPKRAAGCPLADLSFLEDVEYVWDILQNINHGGYIPVTYANSHADVKAFCGRNNGLICTSSNVERVFRWILGNEKRVFFMPDRNLGINTAFAMGLEKDYQVVDGYSRGDLNKLKEKKLIIWNGYCIVHRLFTLEHVQYWRKRDREIKIIVHPECEPEVVGASDYSGSTSKIKRMVEEAEKGSKWVIGTEFNLVNRLKQNLRDKFIEPLEKSVCVNMSKIRSRDLLRTLLTIKDGDFSEQVLVSEDVKRDAKIAIERMLKLSYG